MFQPCDKFYNNIQLNSVIFESQGIVVNEAMDIEKRKKYVLIERSTSDENEYAELQKDICAFDKSDSPYILKIHRYTYDLIIPESTKSYAKDFSATRQQNLFTKSGQSIMNNPNKGETFSNKKLYKLSFLTDFFTTNLKLWIEKKRQDIDKHNSQFKQNSLYQKGNIRKGLPQYEYCSLLHQMVEGVNQVYQRENKRNNSSLKDYVCNVDILAENFVVNESVDLESKIKFIPINFLSVYSKSSKKRFTSLLEHQEKYTLKRRQTLELQNEYLFSITSPQSSKNITNGKKSKTFTNFVEQDFSQIKSGSTTSASLTGINMSSNSNGQSEDTESKYMRQLFDLGLRLGSLYIGGDNFTDPLQPLSQFSRQVFSDVCRNYKNVSTILAQMIDATYYVSNITSQINYKKANLNSICSDLKKVNDQEYQFDENNNLGGTKLGDDLINNDWPDSSQNISKISSPKQQVASLLNLKKQSSILSSGSTSSFNSIPNDFNIGGLQDQNIQKSLNNIKRQDSLRRKSSKLSNEKIKYLETSPTAAASSNGTAGQHSCQIEIYDIEYAYEKKPKKYKGLVFITPYTNLLNVIHINEKKNAYMEKIEIKQPEKVIIPHEHSSIIVPGVGEYRVYIMGGQDSIQMYEFHSVVDAKLIRKQNMLAVKERKNFGVCVFDRDTKIFVATGIKDEQLTSQCEVFDIENNSWTKVSNVNVAVVGASLCMFNRQSIYKFGGVDSNNKITKAIEKYDTYTDVWRCVQYDIDPYLQQGISFSKNMISVQINHNQIIIFGGENTTSNHRHPFYQMQPPNSPPPANINRKIFFCHIDQLGHHELFGIDQYGFVPENAGYILPGQIALSEGEVIFFQKQLYRSDTGKLLGFSVENQVRDIRGTDIRF